MSTDAIFRRYIAAIQDAAEQLTPADMGAIRMGLRLALADAQAACTARNAELSDIASQAIAERTALATQVGDLEQQILRLQTMEDRLATWLSRHEPAIAAQFDGDTGAAILRMLDSRYSVLPVNASTPAQQHNLTMLAERVADTIAAAKPHTNGNGHNGHHPAGGETVAPPAAATTKRSPGVRYNLTTDELRTRTLAALRQLTTELGRQPTLRQWDENSGRLGLPTIALICKKLGTKYNELCAAALSTTTPDKEAPADAPATFLS